MPIKDTVTNRIKNKQWVFTKNQLENFGKSFNKYKKVIKLSDQTVVTVPDWDLIYFKSGVKTNDNRVVWYEENTQKIFHIEKFDEMYRQWVFLRDGLSFGNEKKFEQLSQTIDQIKTEKIFNDY